MNAAKTSETSDKALMNAQQARREVDRAQANRDELMERIAQAIRQDGTIEPMKGLHLKRSSSSREFCYGVSIPAFCAIAQGSKEVLLGNERYQYDSMHYLLATAELPIVSQILEVKSRANVKAIGVSSLDAPLLDAVVRLVRLLDTSAEARVLMPLVTREISCRLLMGEQGSRLRHIAVLGVVVAL